MTAAACSLYRHLYPLRLLAVVVAVAIAATAATPTRPAYATTETTVGGPVPMTFEGGETATVLPDDTLYLFEEEVVVALNATAAAAGDYAYEDYDGSSTDVLQTLGGRYSSEPEKYVLIKAGSTAVPTTMTSTAVPPTTSSTAVSTTTTSIAVPAMNSTAVHPTTPSTAVSTTTTSIAVPAMNSTAVHPTTPSTAVSTTTTSIAVPAMNSTAVHPTTTSTATASTVTTESGILMQIASPLGHGASSTTTTITTTSMPTPSFAAALSRRSAVFRVVLTAAACTLLWF